MKIKEVLEMTQTIPLATIAKEHLTIGKVKATEALKAAGCYSKNGVKGWFYDGDESILEKSIYDFVATSQRKAIPRKLNTSIETSDNAGNTDNISKVTDSTNASKVVASNKQVANEEIATASNQIAGASELDAIDKLLLQNDSTSNQRVYRGFYWDADIIHFLDNVKHGNKSDLMNEIVRTVLKSKGLL